MKKIPKDFQSTARFSDAPHTELNLERTIDPQAVDKQLSGLNKFSAELLEGIEIAPLGGESAGEARSETNEPVYSSADLKNIQGNVIPGFNKDHQHFLFIRISDVSEAKKWLRDFAKEISALDKVLAFKRMHRAQKLKQGVREPALHVTWVNIAFSYDAIRKLASTADADKFGDESFRQGLAERSTYLGDPVEAAEPGYRANWLVGGPGNEADILVIAAADRLDDLDEKVEALKQQLSLAGLGILHQERCNTLPGPLRGHEHFGFKDGVSQPGVRGKVSSAPGDFITPRYIRREDRRSEYFSKPGQLLLWPGQFLLGEPRQNPEDLTGQSPPILATKYPQWAKHGSYLVCRRLRQDVRAFWNFVTAAAAPLGLDPVKFASMMVGRWPSGAPLMRAPDADNGKLAGDEWANNHFIFDDDTRPSQLRPIENYGGDNYPAAKADVLGAVCPHFAHIRKSNPRDAATDLGKPQDSLLRMILRRGIPFGRPIAGVESSSQDPIDEDRGLMFICYGASIEDQFEFLVRRWVNSPIHPNDNGIDPILGRTDGRNGRKRYIDFPAADQARRVELRDDWVIPTGGGYFFAPPISAITAVLGA